MARFVKYPEGTDSFGLIGTAVVGFVVSTTGEVTDIQMINSLSYASDQEVISVLKKTSGNWSPAVVNGKVVSMKREVSVVFKPNKNYDLTKIALKSKEKAEEKLQSNDPKKAIKYYDRAIMVLPYEQSFFAARGLCKYETGDIEGARADWERINYLNKYDSSVFNYKPAHIDPNFKSLKGYDQLCQSLN